MATRKIVDLTQATTASDADLMVIQDTSKTKKITFSTLLTSIKAKLGVGTAANLSTTSKEIVGAINEINTNLNVPAEISQQQCYGYAAGCSIDSQYVPGGGYAITMKYSNGMKKLSFSVYHASGTLAYNSIFFRINAAHKPSVYTESVVRKGSNALCVAVLGTDGTVVIGAPITAIANGIIIGEIWYM